MKTDTGAGEAVAICLGESSQASLSCMWATVCAASSSLISMPHFICKRLCVFHHIGYTDAVLAYLCLCISYARSNTAVAATSVSLTVFVFWLSGLSLRCYVDHVVSNLSLHCRGYSLKVFCDGTDRVFLNLAHAQWVFFSQGSICRIACAFRTCQP